MLLRFPLAIAIPWTLYALAPSAGAVEPVRQVAVYVTPYYEAAQTPDGRPKVAVGEQYSALLGSNRREDIVAVRDRIRSQPDLVTPMALMVLAIRLYDVGLRDDAVFWFYVAKNRYATLAEAADMRASSLAQVEQATRDFATLAGPTINGYAFCDIARQKKAAVDAIDWVESHPYKAIFLPQIPARPGDRAANVKRAIDMLREGTRKEAAYLDDPANLAKFKATRRENHADEKYCWK